MHFAVISANEVMAVSHSDVLARSLGRCCRLVAKSRNGLMFFNFKSIGGDTNNTCPTEKVMSRYNLPKLARYIPLRERSIPKYPLWFRGGPQLRVMMPLFWVKLINRNERLPPNQVNFEVHPQMTKYDIKNYLEKIYKIPVDHVAVGRARGEEHNHPQDGYLLRRDPDKKYATIWLGEGKTFKFPDMFEEKTTPEKKNAEDHTKMTKEMEKERQKSWQMSDLPTWFR